MAKHNGLIPSDEADKLYSYPTLPADSSKILLGNGTWGAGYTHPTRTAVTGKPTANQTPAFGATATISQYAFDTLGHITSTTDRTIKIPDAVATTVAAGLMSKDDKIKLNGIAAGAQVNTVTGIKGNAESAYRTGNVNITAANVGAAASNHTHSDATTVTGGFMSASDKQTLNDIVAELENMPRPIVRAFSVTGSTITATCDTITLTPVEEGGGIWEFKLPRYGTWTLTSTTPTGETYTKVVDVDDVKKYVVGLGIEVKRYGYRIKESEPDPYERVEYIIDAVGMTPAHMDFENEVFDYGSWRDVWFVADNKPLMLKYDGTVDYYLDPNDYTLREDGETESDVSNTAYEGNAMAQFPLCWIYRYEDDTYKYEIVSNVKYDENYKAYAHTRADGTIGDYFYYAIYTATTIGTRLRSISDTKFNPNTSSKQATPVNACIYAANNGVTYSIDTWSRLLFINTLLVLIGKSLNPREIFGKGYATDERRVPTSGSMNKKGQFYGYETIGTNMKCFHVEDFYGVCMHNVLGLLLCNSELYVKMTPEGGGYQLTSLQGYEKTASYDGTIDGFISKAKYNTYGISPAEFEGSNSTYYCSQWYALASSNIYTARVGWSSGPGNSIKNGLYSAWLHGTASSATWAYGYRIIAD